MSSGGSLVRSWTGVVVVAEVDGCASLPELAALGKRLYTLALSRDRAGVAWSHYQLRSSRARAAFS